MGCPVQFFHNLDDTQPTTRLLKNATRFSRLSSWLTLQTNSQDSFPQDSAVLPTGINSDCYDGRRHLVIFNGWQQITLRNYTELDTLQKIGATRPFIPPTRPPDARPPPGHPDATRTPPFTAPTPKVARNSATRKFSTAHKRCNPNGQVSKFERFTWNYVRHFSATTPILGRRPPDTQASYPTTAHTPLHHPTPKVARNSATRKINTAHKRCNTNDLVSKFERFTWNYVRHFSATTPILGHCPPDTQASYPTTAHAQPTPPFTIPPQKSHVIRLPENSTPPTNVAIPTV